MKLVQENRHMQEWKANLFNLGLLTLVTVVVWITLSVYSHFSKTTVDPEMEKIIQPLSPNLDVDMVKTFASSRIEPPQTFTITAKIKQDQTETTVTINPFTETVTPLEPAGSPSASIEE